MQRENRETIAGISLSHPDKVLFDAQGLTKADIARHYVRVAERMLPAVRNRLISLVRCPDGRSKECFFQKHAGRGFPKAVRRQEITEKDGGTAEYLYVGDLAGIVAGVQMNTLEFHIWGSRIDSLEKPDRLVFDLDPAEGLAFGDVRQAALDLRDRLEGLGLKSLPLVTGGKGVHVVAPLARRTEWPQVKAFARAVANRMGEEEPERFLAQASKEKRKGRIFIDWLRNERGATAIAPYSTRARQGAPIAMPVSWEEFGGLSAANTFRIQDMGARMTAPDPWAEAEGWRQGITKTMLEKIGADAYGG
ncbi:non-homologous end-joining DNA ligase [Chelativorans sp. AA-79]|uniref:non-homologous end-joining DNA ligase n=1 Tax=Chelativorans sp. AA-79 TaxID=3028735 RepID=UPI0023FA3185|nr:non-homologous end-joining DNA ligase [Chelativorans sp. AA-79]WEX11425.1 non-homologous end-joining DNA ligase [Chelativorans sp. AA-79]